MAWTAPRGPEINEDDVVVLDGGLEVVVGELDGRHDASLLDAVVVEVPSRAWTAMSEWAQQMTPAPTHHERQNCTPSYRQPRSHSSSLPGCAATPSDQGRKT